MKEQFKRIAKQASKKDCELCFGEGVLKDKHSEYYCECVIKQYPNVEWLDQIVEDTLKSIQEHTDSKVKYDYTRMAYPHVMIICGMFDKESEMVLFDSECAYVFKRLVESGIIKPFENTYTIHQNEVVCVLDETVDVTLGGNYRLQKEGNTFLKGIDYVIKEDGLYLSKDYKSRLESKF